MYEQVLFAFFTFGCCEAVVHQHVTKVLWYYNICNMKKLPLENINEGREDDSHIYYKILL